jgi:hypothetical protein
MMTVFVKPKEGLKIRLNSGLFLSKKGEYLSMSPALIRKINSGDIVVCNPDETKEVKKEDIKKTDKKVKK